MADSADVAAAKAEFKKYFEAREMGIPATPGALEPIQYAAPVAVHAPVTYAAAYAPSLYNYNYNYALPAYTYANTWGKLVRLKSCADFLGALSRLQSSLTPRFQHITDLRQLGLSL